MYSLHFFFLYCLNFCLYRPLKGSHGDQPGHSEKWYKPGTLEATIRVHPQPPHSLSPLFAGSFPMVKAEQKGTGLWDGKESPEFQCDEETCAGGLQDAQGPHGVSGGILIFFFFSSLEKGKGGYILSLEELEVCQEEKDCHQPRQNYAQKLSLCLGRPENSPCRWEAQGEGGCVQRRGCGFRL